MTGSFLVILPVMIPLTAGVVSLMFVRFPKVRAGLSLSVMAVSLGISCLILFEVHTHGEPAC